MKTKKLKNGLYCVGIVIFLVTHLYMLAYDFPAEQIKPHAILNLVAAALIIFACRKSK